MKILLWLERHVAWFRVDGWHQDPEMPILDRLHASRPDSARPALPATPMVKTHRTIFVNIATSVGGAVIIGVLSGFATAERVGQRITDTLKDHESRITIIESSYVPQRVANAETGKTQSEMDALGQRETETRTEMISLQSEFNQLLLQQRNSSR